MLDLAGREITNPSFEVPDTPEALLSMHQNPVLVQYEFTREGIDARLGVDLAVRDGAIEARKTACIENSDNPQPIDGKKASFLPKRIRPVPEFGVASVTTPNSLTGRLSLLREATFSDGQVITPERATNGMFDATRSILTQLEKREFELITSGLIEANGVVLSQPDANEAVIVRSERGASIYLGAHFEKYGAEGAQLGIHGTEAFSYKADASPKSYHHWEHFAGSRGPDRGQFTDRTNWSPGVLMFSPGEQSQVEVAQVSIDELIDEHGRIISPYQLMHS